MSAHSIIQLCFQMAANTNNKSREMKDAVDLLYSDDDIVFFIDLSIHLV